MRPYPVAVLRLRADPWMPDYGMGFEVRDDEERLAPEPFVETEDWTVAIAAKELASMPLWFVDGVRRVEMRVLAEDERGRRGSGLLGTFGVGSVHCDGTAAFGEHEIGRALVLDHGLPAERLEVRQGSGTLVFEPHRCTGSEPDAALRELQAVMREREAALAVRIATDVGSLVFVDGPLTRRHDVDTPGAVVGLIKRFHAEYLAPEHAALRRRLRLGERTPVFGLVDPEKGEKRIRRYSWYLRLRDVVAPFHDESGLVRCEVRGEAGVAAAIGAAERSAAYLPAFAGRAQDPRTPQNLAPIAGLETWLRHRMGDTALVQRALRAHLLEAA